MPGHGIRQASVVHQKPVLRTTIPPFEVMSDERARAAKPVIDGRVPAATWPCVATLG
jgi:hypothetical protein